MHGPPSGPVVPMLQMHAVMEALFAGELESAGHAEHTDPDVAPGTSENVPATQSLQSAAPLTSLYLPGTHRPQGPPAGPEDPTLQEQSLGSSLLTGEFEWAGHDRHSDLSADEYLPASQSEHVDSADAPAAFEDLPAVQSLQDTDPVEALYLPATHSMHEPPSSPENPALQVQDVNAEPTGECEFIGHTTHVDSAAPPSALEYLPAPQSAQAPSPAQSLYLPATHPTHSPPFGPVKPAVHIQPKAAALPAGASEFVGHAAHVLSAVCPTAAEYFPAPQSVHGASPVPALYLPAPHSTHVPPSGPSKPALHAQFVLPAPLYEFAGHGEHSAGPAAALYLDTGHSSQSPGGPVNPGGQTSRQSDAATLPAADLLPEGHNTQTDASPAPFVPEYVPAAHAVHTDGDTAPEASEYLPAAQLLHGALLAPTLYLPAAHSKHC